MSAWPPPGQRMVNVALEPKQIEYLLDHMLTDELRTRPNPGAATVVRQIVIEAIAAHRKQQMALRVQAAAGGADRSRLMAGR